MPVHMTDDGVRLDYLLTGPEDAPALVLSNSLGTDRSLWDAQMDRLGLFYRVLRYDTRGHGASDAPAGDYSLERLGRDVVSLMDRAGLARAHVAGVSLGGITALWLGVHAPDRVDRLVLANTAARIGSVASWADRKRLIETGGLAAIAELTMERWFTATFRSAQPETVARVRARLVAVPVTGYLGCCAALRDADLRVEAGGVGARTLVVTGTHDPATPPADGAFLAEVIPGASLLELDAAHLTNVECAEAFSDALVAFLAA
ncbi:MAG TPA: 3-oxoadipate enol-lactonase [Vicinamibacterales bacterium]|nr:3-oxoadipate enol-lactonase [Vicinamibacterales bacterium]